LFSVVTGRDADHATTARAESRMAVVKVPDPRLPRLAEILHSVKIIHPEMVFVDLPALHRDDGEGPRDESLSKVVGDADALALVIQCFGELDYQGEPAGPAADLESAAAGDDDH
jgi:ribosome-binding ATPase YchF (GTP1/OBG family)